MTTVNLKLKLLVDKAGRKVLFAEADKDVVDFLFSVLALPLADVVRLVSRQSMTGCLGNLYQSVESLDDAYLQQGDRDRGVLLKPRVISPAICGNAALTWKKEGWAPGTFYACVNHHPIYFSASANHSGYVSDYAGAICPSCGNKMNTRLKYVPSPAVGKEASGVASSGDGRGFVKSAVTYMVTDDLTVAPMSTISTITLLNRFGVKELGSLEERTVQLGMNEALEMLRASLQSTSVLTDVFFRKKRK